MPETICFVPKILGVRSIWLVVTPTFPQLITPFAALVLHFIYASVVSSD